MTNTKDHTLTPLQELFLEALFGVAKGDPMRAKKLAGYPDNIGLRTVMKGISEELLKEASAYITIHSVKAAQGIIGIMDDPTAPGSSNLLAAANSVLDRAGLTKKDKLEVTVETPSSLLILPQKLTRPSESPVVTEDLE